MLSQRRPVRFFAPARLSTSHKPSFSLKPLDARSERLRCSCSPPSQPFRVQPFFFLVYILFYKGGNPLQKHFETLRIFARISKFRCFHDQETKQTQNKDGRFFYHLRINSNESVAVRSKCFGKELPPSSNFPFSFNFLARWHAGYCQMYKPNKNILSTERPRSGAHLVGSCLGTSLAFSATEGLEGRGWGVLIPHSRSFCTRIPHSFFPNPVFLFQRNTLKSLITTKDNQCKV